MPERLKALAWIVAPVAVVLVVAFLLIGRQANVLPDPVSPSASAKASLLARVSLSPFPSPNWPPTAAASLETHLVPLDGTVRGVTLAGERVIAVGRDGGGAAAWYSDDAGETWDRATVDSLEPPRGSEQPILETVAAYGRLVAFGRWENPNDPAVWVVGSWISDDAGQSWRERPREDLPNLVVDMATDALGFVAVGGRSGGNVWHSDDGVTWDSVPGDWRVGQSQLLGIAVGSRGAIIGGMAAGAVQPRLWTYSDVASSTGSEGIGTAVVTAMAVDHAGFWLGGQSYPTADDLNTADATVWFSKDAMAWQSVVVDGSGHSQVARAASGPLGILMTGTLLRDRSDPASRFQPYGWFFPEQTDPLSHVQTYPTEQLITAVIGLRDRFLAFGRCDAAAACSGSGVVIFAGSDAAYASHSGSR